MIAVDASVVVLALAEDGPDGDDARRRLHDEELVAPQLIDLEVLAAWRRLAGTGNLDERRTTLAIADLRDLDLERVAHEPLIQRCWELRHSVTPYDAAYVAVAEAYEVPLVTADARLARAPGPRCRFEVLEG